MKEHVHVPEPGGFRPEVPVAPSGRQEVEQPIFGIGGMFFDAFMRRFL